MRRIVAIFLLAGSVLTLKAQLTVSEAFVTMPADLFPYLNTKQRLYLLEYAKAGSTDSIINLFDEPTSVPAYQPDMLGIKVAEGVEYDLLLKGDTIIFIQTVCAPICSSIVKVYDKKWNYLYTLRPTIDAMFVKATIENSEVVFTDETPLLLDDEERKHYLSE